MSASSRAGDDLRPRECSTKEHLLQMLKAIQGGKTIEELADELHVSTTTIDAWRSRLRDGVDFLDSRVQVDFKRGGKMDTTVHPVFLPANSSEIFVLLEALLGYAKEHEGAPMGIVAQELAGKVYSQLTDYAKNLVDGALGEAGFHAPSPVCPDFRMDNAGKNDPIYLVKLEKSGMNVEVIYDSGDGKAYVRGKISHERPKDPARAKGCIVVRTNDGSEVYIKKDRILFVNEL